MPATQQQLDSLAKGREAKRLKREAGKLTRVFDGPDDPALHQAEPLDLLKRLLEGMRVKTLMRSYKRGMCLACNRPHILGVCVQECICHEAKRYLEAHGIRVDI